MQTHAPVTERADLFHPPYAEQLHAACLSVRAGQFSSGSPWTGMLIVNLQVSHLPGDSQTQFGVCFFFFSSRLRCFGVCSISPSVEAVIASSLHHAAEHTLPPHACFPLFIFTDKFIAFFLSLALFLVSFNYFSTTFPVPLLSFLIYSCFVVPWINSLLLALKGISVFSLSSRKGTGTGWHGRKEKGRDVPLCRHGGRCDIMRFACCFIPSLDRCFLQIHKSSPVDVSSCTLLQLFQAATTASS